VNVFGLPPLDAALAGATVLALGYALVQVVETMELARESEASARAVPLDEQTGLPTRTAFDQLVEGELSRAARMQRGVTCEVIAGVPEHDVENFGARLAVFVEFPDTAFRLEADTFCVVRPDTVAGARSANNLLELPAARVARARYPADGSTAEELLGVCMGALAPTPDGAAAP
jgi:GGDEF domain-containing protein